MTTIIEKVWQKGYPSGTIGFTDLQNGYHVRFFKLAAHNGMFKLKNYNNNHNEAKNAAINYRYTKSTELGLTKNRYKYTEDYVTIELHKGHFAKIDSEDLQIFIKNGPWSTKPSGKNLYLWHNKRAGINAEKFHNIICPQWDKITHINNNCLDNRKINLRNSKEINKKQNVWKGGNPVGSVSYDKSSDGYKVYFRNICLNTSNKKLYKLFKLKDYNNNHYQAKNACLSYRFKTSNELGLTKNRYKYTTDYITVELLHGKFAKIDPEDLHFLVQYGITWGAQKSKKRHYLAHSERPKHGLKGRRFHNVICPQWEFVDHINRDGLDNRKCNLRDGSGSINNHNQGMRTDNTSGKTGVSWHSGKNAWVIQYQEGGKRKQKYYCVGRRTIEEAKNLAIIFRKQKDKELNLRNGYDSDEEIPEINTKLIDNEMPKFKIKGPIFSLNYWEAFLCEKSKKSLKDFSNKKFEMFASIKQRLKLIKPPCDVVGVCKYNNRWYANWEENGVLMTYFYSIRIYKDDARLFAIVKMLEMTNQ